jgi:anti-sigma-K factor RskA
MLSDTAKVEIDNMSREELTLELNKGNRSRFQRDNFAYLQTRLSELNKQENTEHSKAQLSLAEEANHIAREANNQSRTANATSAKAYRMATLSAIVALLAVIVAALAQCQNAT